MKREEIKTLLESDVAVEEKIDKILKTNGADIENAKGKLTSAETELATAKATIDTITNELNELKNKSASAEDWEQKFNALTEQIEADKQAAEQERTAKEKAEQIASRFATAKGEKKFAHSAIESDYLKKFGDALDSTDYAGKSDAEIFNDLSKDDENAFIGVRKIILAGGKSIDDTDIDDNKARAIMGLNPKK